jgi:hypothetical protein
MNEELWIIGSNSCADKYPEAVADMAQIHARAAVLLGKTFPIWDFAEAVQCMSDGGDVKTQLIVS